MSKWKVVKDIISKESDIVIVSHRSPDGDSIGSSLGMSSFLNKLKNRLTVITPDAAPKFLNWMEGFDSILNFEKNQEEATGKIENAAVIVCLDFNTLSRLGEGLETEIRKNTAAYIINIDHHQEPDDFANFQLSDTSASSTAQLVYEFIEKLEQVELIDKKMADCLYTGILTDTGSFRFSSTSSKTHEIAAKLMKTGIEPHLIHQRIYDNYSLDRLKLVGFALNEKFKVYPQFKTGIIYLKEKELNSFQFQKGDTEGLVNYPLSVSDINASILITEKDGKVKMSFRSKGSFRINEVAKKYFSGGGHINAAGGISDVGVDETVKKLEKILVEYEAELQYSN